MSRIATATFFNDTHAQASLPAFSYGTATFVDVVCFRMQSGTKWTIIGTPSTLRLTGPIASSADPTGSELK